MKPVKVFLLLMMALLSLSSLRADDTIPLPPKNENSDPPSKRSPSNSLIQITCEDGIIEICFLQDMGIVCCEVLNPATFESMTSVINTQVGTELIKLPDAYNTYIIVIKTMSGEFITSYLVN